MSLKTGAIINAELKTVKKNFSQSGERADEFDFYVGECVDELNLKIFAARDELPLAQRIRERGNFLNLEIGERVDNLNFDIGKSRDDANFAVKPNPLEITVARNGICKRTCTDRADYQRKHGGNKVFHRANAPFVVKQKIF